MLCLNILNKINLKQSVPIINELLFVNDISISCYLVLPLFFRELRKLDKMQAADIRPALCAMSHTPQTSECNLWPENFVLSAEFTYDVPGQIS
jgi:hypothetical protein